MNASIKDRFHAATKELARGIDQRLNGVRNPGDPPRFGFALFAIERTNDSMGSFNYTSNVDRKVMIPLLRTYLAELESGRDD